ncbi:MAG TPA: c-type cytochrome [Verrucomicrobiae bacterium]|jgi:putative heme-binding domain-containing protein
MRWVLIAALCAARIFGATTDAEEQQKIATAVEALTRLENINLEEKPAIKAAVNRVLEKTRGTPDFLKLVQHFKLTNQNTALLALAIDHSTNETGVAAIRLVLANQDATAVKQALQTTNAPEAVRLIEALGNAKEKQAVPWLVPLITNDTAGVEVQRATVRALAQTQDGVAALLAFAKDDTLPEKLKFVAATELNAARWPEIKSAAAKILPLPAGQNSQPLPPVTELIKLKGSVAKGAEIFRRETTGCIKCHQVRGEGRDLGPALSEIGTKLPKEALYEAILDPSAGISFGFEAWQVEFKSGDEAYGIKASDTPDEIAIKDTNGIITRHKRSQIASMQQMKTSIMPAGLQQTISTQELVDLVEYLFSLKKQP